MGIGRREFLRVFGAGIAAVATNPPRAIAIVDNHYVNRRLGIAFQKPNGWVFADVKQMGDVKAGQVLDLDDLDFSREIVDAVELPILTISKDGISADSNRFTPGATVYLDRLTGDECGDSGKGIEPVHSLAVDADSCDIILKDFRVTSAPRATRVSLCDAAEYEASFIFEHENLEPTLVRMKTLAIEQGTAFYTLRMYDSPFVGDDLLFDYTPFIASIIMV